MHNRHPIHDNAIRNERQKALPALPSSPALIIENEEQNLVGKRAFERQAIKYATQDLVFGTGAAVKGKLEKSVSPTSIVYTFSLISCKELNPSRLYRPVTGRSTERPFVPNA